MKTKLFSLVLILCLLCGCAAQTQPAVTDSPEAVTFTDDLGRTVTVSNPQRVAALLGSFAEVWQSSATNWPLPVSSVSTPVLVWP